MIRTSEAVSKRMELLPPLAQVLKRALILSSKEVNKLEGGRSLHFHLVRKREEFLLKLELEVDRYSSFDALRVIELVNVKILDFMGVKSIYGGLSSKEEFLSGLERFKRLEVEEVEEVEEEIPKALSFGKTDVKLSHELIIGMQGQRTADHCIDISILQQCLAKKITRLAAAKEKNRFDFYFNEMRDNQQKFLNVVVAKYHDTNTLMVITAYYVTSSLFQCRMKLNGVRFQAFVENLPRVSIN